MSDMNPYEPPHQGRKKYKPPMIDWFGLGFVLGVFVFWILILMTYFYLVGVITEWLSQL
jgi:hypothetical protein